jgi:hypothetical protein
METKQCSTVYSIIWYNTDLESVVLDTALILNQGSIIRSSFRISAEFNTADSESVLYQKTLVQMNILFKISSLPDTVPLNAELDL